MYSAPLTAVRHKVLVGEPLPFDVYGDGETELLLARGRTLRTTGQLESLLGRGTRALLDESLEPIEVARHVPTRDLPKVWRQARDRLTGTLDCAPGLEFLERLQVSVTQFAALVSRDRDLAMFEVLSEPEAADDTAEAAPGALHAMQCAVMTMLIARGLHWGDDATELAAKVALTRNLSILRRADIFAERAIGGPLRSDAAGLEHRLRSRELLEQSGVTDRAWLRAVAEVDAEGEGAAAGADGGETSALLSIVRCAASFVTGFAGQPGGEGPGADHVMRTIYQAERGNRYVATLVRETGIYPPGCAVTLATGETGIVMRRGRSIQSPLVAVMLSRFERVFDPPIPRDTSERGQGIVRALPRGRFRPSRMQLDRALQGVMSAAGRAN